ncbi:hypothetical protein, partial [Bartonella sp. CR127HXZ]|uniref:hypothetical protein n=1 Tax=Bartonella sp. CR127HXZ TaxID=1460985 RepID=UPI0035CF77FB
MMICRIRQNASSEPKFHHMEMLDGVGRSMREWLIIFIIGLDLRIGVSGAGAAQDDRCFWYPAKERSSFTVPKSSSLMWP